MMRTPISLLIEAAEHGQRLEAHGDKLRVIPGQGLPSDFVDALRAYKRQLLALLDVPFVCVNAQAIGETLFFCADEETRRALVRAGASPLRCYTRAELTILCEQNRIAPLTCDELCALHEIKKTFAAQITK